MNPAADVWSKVLELMQPEMTPTTINTWFEDAIPVALEDDRFVLCVPSAFKQGIIQTRYIPFIQKALFELFSADLEVLVLNEQELEHYRKPVSRGGFLPGTENYTFERERTWQINNLKPRQYK